MSTGMKMGIHKTKGLVPFLFYGARITALWHWFQGHLVVMLLCCSALSAQPQTIMEGNENTVEAGEQQSVARKKGYSGQLPRIQVVGEEDERQKISGSASVIKKEELEAARVFTTNEALRKVSGVNVRDEEGFALRPNIGIRGLNPTRSSKVLLLEDGIPLSYAPYGDNASYYHPPIERFSRIEVLKGAGQIKFGPQTVGGVINYITPEPPAEPGGIITLVGGNREYFNGHFQYGGFWGNSGFLLDYSRKQGQGARENTYTTLNDLNLKNVLLLNENHAFTIRNNVYTEDSQVTYSGLTAAEYRDNPRQNPFKNDTMVAKRFGSSATHAWYFLPGSELTTTLYGSVFQRDWWRQASNSGQRPNDASDATCGGMDNLNTSCGNEGRLREYYTYGIEPRLKFEYFIKGEKQELNLGLRAHYEIQDRKQINGDFPRSRVPGTSTNGGLKEDNERKVDAYAAFIDQRFSWGDFSITPGVRVEHMIYERTNRLAGNLGNYGVGVHGKAELTEVIPGVGLSYQAPANNTIFAGVHKGFSPPRVEDKINNNDGTVVDIDPERSINYEAGWRSRTIRGLIFEATYFRMDFENQIVPASVAGGSGATLTNAGKTEHQGLEADFRINTGELLSSKHNVYLTSAYTWLPTARYAGTRFSAITPTEKVTGNRLPYSPEHLVTTTLGYAHPIGLDVRIEQVYVAAMFSDDLNTVAETANGQRGKIPAYTLYNLAINYTYAPWGTTAFFTVKNLTDELYIADRTRGILPGTPRLFQGGVQLRF